MLNFCFTRTDWYVLLTFCTSVVRVANVRHSHVILYIRNTHILSQQRSTQVKELIRVSRKHYIAENGTAQPSRIGF